MKRLTELGDSEVFSALDLHFGRFIQKLSGEKTEAIIPLSAMLVSHVLQQGNVCLDIASLTGETVTTGEPGAAAIQLPGLQSWRNDLMASPVVGTPQERCPLILDEKNRLYLYRYWKYEKRLTELIKARTQNNDRVFFDPDCLRESLKKNFPHEESIQIDWQEIAAAVAACRSFCVISGGPGTGKTFAVAKILAVLLAQSPGRNLRILLCAPTGKAAARLAESIGRAKSKLVCDADIIRAIPEKGETVHRILKPLRRSFKFFYHAENKLPVDIVVVDEASMMDLPLMSKLIQALPDSTRLILVGDRHQLASVEAGSVLGDICGEKQDNGFTIGFAKQIEAFVTDSSGSLPRTREYRSGIQDSILFFTHPYRFDAKSGIHALSRAVNSGDAAAAMGILSKNTYDDLEWIKGPDRKVLHEMLLRKYSGLAAMHEPAEMLAYLNRFRIVCAVNRGPLGVATFNDWVESALKNAAVIHQGSAVPRPSGWYAGKPVMVTQNDYELGLFNGDVGVAFRDRNDALEMMVCFPDTRNRVRQFPVHRLPPHTTVYAMTVHKSQGSEFDEMLLVLPDSDSPLLTRELLYTGITRARQKLSILAGESVIRTAISRTIKRTSGLRDALWG